MARNHLHFLRLNPVAPRTHKSSMDVSGVLAWLFDLPVLLFWGTWVMSAVFGIPGPFRAIFSQNLTQKGMLYVLSLGFPVAGLVFGIISFNQRRRRSDLGVAAVPLSLILIGAGLLYGIVRVASS